MINLVDELTKAYNGDAWHGNNILNLLLKVDSTKVFTHPIPNGHSIAELTLHLTAWTEEVIDRLSGGAAKEPTSGDWPMPTDLSEAEWSVIMENFKAANEKLIERVNNFMASDWSTEVRDDRDLSIADSKTNNAQLLNGLIQHHAYHSGQIALLMKF